jgi:hypothetical protein
MTSRLSFSAVRPLSAILIVGFLARMVIAWLPLDWLLRNVLADDSFYYFTIARHAARGDGFTFDGLAATNGFHPLWMILLLPLQLVASDRTLFIHLALSLAALVECGSIVLLHKLLHRIGVKPPAATLILTLLSLAPVLLTYGGGMNGMETSVNTFLVFSFLVLYIAAYSEGIQNWRAGVLLGSVSGLLLLARTDNIIIVSICYIGLLMSPSKLWKQVGRLLFSVGIASLLVAPWLIWNYLRFGTVMQVSGVALGEMIRLSLPADAHSSAGIALQFVKNVAGIVTHFPVHLHDVETTNFLAFVQACALIALVLAAFVRARRTRNPEFSAVSMQWLLYPSIGVLLFILVQTIRAVYMRSWYYSSITPVLLPALGIVVQMWLEGSSSTLKASKYLIMLAALGLVVAGTVLALRPRSGEIDKFKMAQRMNTFLPQGSIVGSWNAGVYGYFFERGTVVGLDGLVNNEVYPYILNRTVEEYCRVRGVEYLVDPVGAFDYAYPLWRRGTAYVTHSLDPVTRVWGTKENDWIVLGRLRR